MTANPSKLVAKDEKKWLSSQRCDVRCAECGALLAEQVPVAKSAKLVERHRKQIHGLVPVEKEPHKRAASGGDETLRVLTTPLTVNEVAEARGVTASTARASLLVLIRRGLVEKLGDEKPFRYAAV